jgi:import receptor subunit TOM70
MQVYLLSDKLDEALADFTKAVKESPGFGLAVVQQYYTVYREAASRRDLIGADQATKDLLAATKRFSDTFQGYLFLAQVPYKL